MTYMVGVSDCAFSTSHHQFGENLAMGRGVLLLCAGFICFLEIVKSFLSRITDFL